MSGVKRPNSNEILCHEKPDAEVVNHYQEKWQEHEQDAALYKLFNETYPHNTALDEVLIKVAVLDNLYLTKLSMVSKVFPVAQHIVSLKIDWRLKTADATLVNDIAKVTYDENKKRDEFSFASKYCCFHRPEHYPIFDSKVRIFLCHCNDNAKKWGQGQPPEKCFAFEPKNLFKGGKNDGTLLDYPRYKDLILNFQRCFGLEAFSFREIDHYLWLAGKELEAENKNKENSVNEPNK